MKRRKKRASDGGDRVLFYRDARQCVSIKRYVFKQDCLYLWDILKINGMKKLYNCFSLAVMFLFLSQVCVLHARVMVEDTSAGKTIALEVAPGMKCSYVSGSYTVNPGDDLLLTFGVEDGAKTAEDVLLLVDGKEAAFKDMGGDYDFVYSLKDVQADHSVVIALRTYPVTIPETEGVYLTPSAGTHEIGYGEKFMLEVMVKAGYDNMNSKVYANDIELVPEPLPEMCPDAEPTLRSEMYYYNGYLVEAVKGPVVFRVEGIVLREGATGNSVVADHRAVVYAAEGSLFVETQRLEAVKVYSVTGALQASRQVNGVTSIPLGKGIYIVNIGAKVYKVVH